MARPIAFAVWSGEPELCADDRLAADACSQRGARVVAVPWDDPKVEWRQFDAIVVRTTWNYHLELERFGGWLDTLSVGNHRVWNSAPLLRWNADKRYLLDLEQDGFAIPQTVVVARGCTPKLSEILATNKWAHAVVKPAVSANAYGTFKVGRLDADLHQHAFERLSLTRDVLIQRFVDEIYESGEMSLVFIDGEYSHAVVKSPSAGEFRVQEERGGRVMTVTPDRSLVEYCHRIVHRAPADALYARVDGVLTTAGFLLMELEMVEPSLYFSLDTAASGRFADALLRRMGQP
jgi:glutathione synthase/RimK-type ligase-like ATP-grasp enzyme